MTPGNGLGTVGAVELEGVADEDRIDGAWIRVSGGFGQPRIARPTPHPRS